MHILMGNLRSRSFGRGLPQNKESQLGRLLWRCLETSKVGAKTKPFPGAIAMGGQVSPEWRLRRSKRLGPRRVFYSYPYPYPDCLSN
jgi:hypothetical protein